MIDHFVNNKTALERAHDQYEEYLNNTNDPHESELYSFHVARVQKWIYIIGNRLHLYYKITTDEEEPEEFELLHDGGDMTCHMMFLVLKQVNLIFTKR